MRRSTALISAGLLSALAAGCGPSLGDPKPATSSQTQAARQLDGTSGQVAQLKTDRAAAFSMYGSVFALGPQAVDLSAKNRAGLLLEPETVDDKCVTGDGSSGWTYACAEVTGTVTFSGATTNIDLKILASGSGASTETTFKGSVTNDSAHIAGDLTAELKYTGISLPGVPSADVKTHVNYDAGYQSAPACITSGKVLVEYSAAGTGGAAQFEYTGCNTYMVRNGG